MAYMSSSLVQAGGVGDIEETDEAHPRDILKHGLKGSRTFPFIIELEKCRLKITMGSTEWKGII